MRNAAAFWAVVFVLVLMMPTAAICEQSDGPKVVSGKVSVGGKYDSNVDLLSETLPPDADEDEGIEDAWITEVAAQLAFRSPWTSGWHIEFAMYGLADLFVQAMEDSWCLGRGNLYVGYNFGQNTISLQDEARYFSEPDDTEFDNLRNSGSLVYKRVFSPLWQGRIGYENIVHAYTENSFLNYYVNGGFIEVRNTWLPEFSTYYSGGFHYYTGGDGADEEEEEGSPDTGRRYTGEIGFESFFARKNTLIGSYTFQKDDNDNPDLQQIGELKGEDENLEVDAEFNFVKHKGMLLYSHKFNDRFTLSLYGELIHKTFSDRETGIEEYDERRVDMLFLSSLWFTARIYDGLYGKAHYLYRMNESTIEFEEFQDHIGYLGLEYRF